MRTDVELQALRRVSESGYEFRPLPSRTVRVGLQVFVRFAAVAFVTLLILAVSSG